MGVLGTAAWRRCFARSRVAHPLNGCTRFRDVEVCSVEIDLGPRGTTRGGGWMCTGHVPTHLHEIHQHLGDDEPAALRVAKLVPERLPAAFSDLQSEPEQRFAERERGGRLCRGPQRYALCRDARRERQERRLAGGKRDESRRQHGRRGASTDERAHTAELAQRWCVAELAGEKLDDLRACAEPSYELGGADVRT